MPEWLAGACIQSSQHSLIVPSKYQPASRGQQSWTIVVRPNLLVLPNQLASSHVQRAHIILPTLRLFGAFHVAGALILGTRVRLEIVAASIVDGTTFRRNNVEIVRVWIVGR